MNRQIRKATLVVGLVSVMGISFTPQVMAATNPAAAAAEQPTKTFKGTVSDSEGPLMGATIMEKGTKNGCVTDVDGNFYLKLTKPNATLVISYVGCKTQEVSTSGKNAANVTLEADGHVLNEVVAIGYGTQRKESVTGSVANVKGDILREVPAADVTGALQGRVAGVQMTQTSSKPGASMQIRIRGTRSLNASNDPLIVLDGIPFAGTLSDIDPNNIKSMDILKDASATAIYGSRGANGVIIITTNKGTKEMKPTVKYNGYIGAKTNFARYPMMNGEQLTKLRSDAGKGYDELSADEVAGTNTDWQSMFFKTGITTNHDLSISGGGMSNSYTAGVSYYRDEATIPTQNFNRYAMHAAIDQEIGKYFKLGLSTNTNYSVTNNASISLYNVLSCSPLINPYNEDGSLKSVVEINKKNSDKQWVYTRDRIENLGDSYADQKRAFATYNSFYGEVKCPWVEGLKYRLNVGLNYRHEKYGYYQGTGVMAENPTNTSSATNSNATTWSWDVEHMLTYDKTFGKHTINAVVLYSAEKTHYDSQYMTATGIKSDAFQYFNIANSDSYTVDPANQGYYECGLTSVMGRIMYSYDDRYMASVTIRHDNSSRLAEGHKGHTYPAVSVGWNIAKEHFFKAKWVDNLKIRFGYGETSNQSVDPYQTLGTLSNAVYNFGSTGYATGYYVSKLPNSELGWEYSKTINVGLDFSLFDGRLYGTFEYYSQKTENLLCSVTLPSTSGVSSYMANVGSTSNKGFEISLNGTIIENKNGWTWDAGINFYHNSNEITALNSGADRDEANGWFVGHSINSIYDYEKIGIWQEEEEEARKIEEPGGCVGMIKVKYTGDYDENGLPTREINASDRQIIELDPKFEGGFNTRVAYKNWDLSMVAAFRCGGKLISTLYGGSSYLNLLSGRRNNIAVDYWTTENTSANFPSPQASIAAGDNVKYANSMGLFDGSYLKMRTITLGYNFNGKWMKSAGLSKLRAYFTVQNPFVLFSPYTNESGMDPETNSYGTENQATTGSYNKRILVVGYSTPTTRNFLFGVNVTF